MLFPRGWEGGVLAELQGLLAALVGEESCGPMESVVCGYWDRLAGLDLFSAFPLVHLFSLSLSLSLSLSGFSSPIIFLSIQFYLFV